MCYVNECSYIGCMSFLSGSVVKNPPANAGDASLIPGLGRHPGEGYGNPLQYSCLENSMKSGIWWATVPRVIKSQTQQSDLAHMLACSKSWRMFFVHLRRMCILLFLAVGCWKYQFNIKGKVRLLSHIWFFVTPWTVAYQTPPSMGFSRKENWSGLPFPSPGDLPDPGIGPRSPAL